jgi:hypothetical protein
LRTGDRTHGTNTSTGTANVAVVLEPVIVTRTCRYSSGANALTVTDPAAVNALLVVPGIVVHVDVSGEDCKLIVTDGVPVTALTMRVARTVCVLPALVSSPDG